MGSPKAELSTQVVAFVARQPPDARKALRRGLRGLARESGDIKALEGRLGGYFRLRVGPFRVIFHYAERGKERLLRCDFAERRSIVYEACEHLARQLR